jgi:sodium-coupled monocarboxylate transporter 8/12
MKAVIWTDVMQFFVLIGGQIVILVIAVSHIPGGMEGVYEMGRDHGKLDIDFSFSPTVRVTFWGALIGGAFMNLVQMATDQVSVQRYLTASSLKEAQRSLWLKLAFLLPVLIIFYLTGLVLYVFYQIHGDPMATGTISKPDQLLPYFVITELPRGMPGLLVAAIFAASMSTISAGINSLTSATLVDFYGRLWKRAKVATDEHQLKLARYFTLFYGTLVMALAFVVHKLGSLLSASNSIIGLVGGPLLGLFLLGMLSKRANATGAVVGWFFGVCTMIWVFADHRISLLWYALIGLTVTLSVGWCVSWLFAPPRPQQLKGFSWDSRYEDEKQPAQNSPDGQLTSAHDDKI